MTTFMHDVPAEVVAELMAAGEPEQAAAIFAQPFPLPAWPDVPTRVIAATNDRLLPLELVRRLAQERLGVEADQVDTGHLAAFSRPNDVTAKLLQHLEAVPA